MEFEVLFFFGSEMKHNKDANVRIATTAQTAPHP
jgi:hypothetical protein